MNLETFNVTGYVCILKMIRMKEMLTSIIFLKNHFKI